MELDSDGPNLKDHRSVLLVRESGTADGSRDDPHGIMVLVSLSRVKFNSNSENPIIASGP